MARIHALGLITFVKNSDTLASIPAKPVKFSDTTTIEIIASVLSEIFTVFHRKGGDVSEYFTMGRIPARGSIFYH